MSPDHKPSLRTDELPSALPDPSQAASLLMQTRQTILPKRLSAPGPDEQALTQILAAAASAPDHGQLLPWRFILVEQGARAALGEVFADALRRRDASATAEQMQQARDKALRSPVLLLAVVDAEKGNGGKVHEGKDDHEVDLNERVLSAGCALQNMMLMATAQGYGSSLTSGKALKDEGFRQWFGLSASEQALCFLSIGTATSRKPVRLRPDASSYVSVHQNTGG